MSTKIRSLMGERLALERGRLKLTQVELAQLGGVKVRTLQDWERGIATPSSEFLAVVSEHRVDVMFVLTGQRMPKTEVSLTEEESALVDNYKHADEEGRAAARRVLSSLAQQKAA
jgi:transcriptional regulator with XRE-family HTH domain